MKKLMPKIRRPVSVVLVIALIVSMSTFLFGFTNNPVDPGHDGFVIASALAALELDEESTSIAPNETHDIETCDEIDCEACSPPITHSPEDCTDPYCEDCIVSDEQPTPATSNGFLQISPATPNGNIEGSDYEQSEPTTTPDFSDLRNFVSNVIVTDLDGNPLEPVSLEDGENDISPFDQPYRFTIEFSEYLSDYYILQFEQNPLTGMLSYQLPLGLEMPAPIAETPIRAEPTIAGELGLIIGWYTISATGLVDVWFEDLTIDGATIPDGRSFVDFYTDITIALTIDAILLEESGGVLDFGNYWILDVPPVYFTRRKRRSA